MRMVTRRDFATGVIGAGFAMTISGARSVQAETAPPTRRRTIVDAQVHLYKAETPDAKWDPDAAQPPIPQFTVEQALPLMDEGGVDRVIIVPPGVMGDRNDYAIEVAQRYPKRFAVMGLFSVAKPGGADRLKTWKQQPGMLGVRLTFLREEAKALADGSTDWFWPAAEKAGIPVMFQAPGSLHRCAAIAERHPGLTLINDHVGMANYIPIERSATDTIALAKYPNVSVKMKAGAQFAPEPWPYRNMNVQLKRVFDAF